MVIARHGIRAALTPPPPDRELVARQVRRSRSSGEWSRELDLSRRFVWALDEREGLDALAHDYAPTAAVLEWLLTEIPEQGARATPPPIPVHARRTVPPAVVSKPEE